MKPFLSLPRQAGFTLAEMVISVAVLSILVLLLMAIMNTTSATVGMSWSRLQSDQDGRLVLDRLQIDLQNMLVRPDIDYEFIQNTGNANDKLAFYATEPGYTSVTSGKRVASVITYVVGVSSTGQPVLQRGANDGFQWIGGSGSPSVPAMIFSSAPQLNVQNNSTIGSLEASSLDTLNPNVFRFEISFLLKNPTNAAAPNQAAPTLVAALPGNTPITNVAAIVVTIAGIDSQNSKIVPATSWAKLITALADANGTPTSGGASTATAWNATINSPAFATTTSLPQKAAAAVRVYERYFYLNCAP
ncbi:MAG: prepilin-type N-terminal cleavage/methylation domain-containing protein [Verrucomicrobiota bacterium]